VFVPKVLSNNSGFSHLIIINAATSSIAAIVMSRIKTIMNTTMNRKSFKMVVLNECLYSLLKAKR